MYKKIAFSVGVLFVAANFLAVVPVTQANSKTENVRNPKQAACGWAGCSGGGQSCATFHVHIDGGVPGVISGAVDATYYCYQKNPQLQKK